MIIGSISVYTHPDSGVKENYLYFLSRKGDGMRLKEIRKQAGYTQEQIAKMLEVTQSAVSQWESGRKMPLGKYRLKLERLFRTKDITYLDGEECEKKK